MEKFAQFFFSMKMMTVGLFVFLGAIATATFLESIYDTQTARIIVYNALWFEILLVYLTSNLISNIFKYKLIQKDKIASLIFHVSFIVIIIGAGVTRYFGYEGSMPIREGEQSNVIYTADPYLWFKINDGKMQYEYNEKMLLSEVTNNDFEFSVVFPNHKTPIKIEYLGYQRRMIDTLIIHDSIKNDVLDIKTDGMKSNYLSKNNFLMIGTIPLSYEKKNAADGINISKINGKLKLTSKFPMKCLPMSEMQKVRQTGMPISEDMYEQIPVDSLVDFKMTTLYLIEGQQFVFKQEIKNAVVTRLHSGKKNVGNDYLTVKITDGNQTKIVDLQGGANAMPEHEVFELNGLTYEMEYGPTRVEIPFYVACNDFRLERYPGSNSPSSFESDLTIIDQKNNYKKDHKVFMNHVIDYNGFRFFQSSYDKDEKGTVLSVNHDWWGTNISYLGYSLMFLGMILNLFASKGRFRELSEKLNKINKKAKHAATIFLFLLSSFYGFGQHNHATHQKPIFRVISKEHSEKLAKMLVQEYDGRISPYHTVCDKLLRDIYNSSKFNEYDAVQTITSMHMYPEHWMNEKIIDVPSNLRAKLNAGKFASFKELTNEKGEFKLAKEYESAFGKLDKNKDEFDKKVIKLLDNYQVVRGIFSWMYMKIIPVNRAQNNTWYIPLSADLMKIDSTSSKLALEYISSLNKGAETKNFKNSDQLLAKFINYQRLVAKKIVPSESKVNIEIRYNKMNIFSNAMKGYITLGLLVLILFFVEIFRSHKTNKIHKILTKTVHVLLAIIFVYHGVGIGFRWIITEHAPWSNGYEAVVFIAWVTMLVGFAFSKKHKLVIPAAAILCSMMIMVTEMSLMDPQITPLVPVLKSYWLMIHVAIITGSYAPLGLACILGFMNLILFIFRTKENAKVFTPNINAITYVSEMAMTLGLFMLICGNFLGGIWANESWGRYWGWDPKETWALVSILVYAIILHLRFIPAASSKFTFNMVSFWGYASILFTFFGVNFYLTGLHSYAQGDEIGTVPNWVKITVIILILFSIFASFRNRKFKKSQIENI